MYSTGSEPPASYISCYPCLLMFPERMSSISAQDMDFFALSISSGSEILSAARILFQMSQGAVESWNIPEPADYIISCYVSI